MIPVRLEMRDFLSYADPEPIDFTRFDVACLTGDNGTGKSALLDAMTYALFGAARGCENRQNQERLIREGADEALVAFTFELNAQTFQIVRRRTRNAKGNEVRFLVQTQGNWTNIAKNSIRDTDQHIEHVLRMDYKTFVNSAFFLQGRAHEFLSAMTPDDRRDVFAKLLDLGTYERLEEAARVRSRAAERNRADLAAQADRLADGAADPATVQAELDEATARAEAARAELVGAEEQLAQAAAQVVDLEKQAAVLASEKQGIAALERTLGETRSAAAARASELQEIDGLLARTDEVAQALDEIERLRRDDAEAREDQARAASLREQVSALTQRIEGERDAIASRQLEREKSIARLEREAKSLDGAEGDLEKVTLALDDSSGVDDELMATASELEAQRAHEAEARDTVAGCDAKLAETTEKLDLLKAKATACPLCGGPLDDAHRREITATLRAAAKQLTADRKLADAERERRAKEVRRLAEETTRLTKVQHERSKLEGMVDGLRAKCDRAAQVRSDIDRLAAEGASDAALLASGDFAVEWRAQIDGLHEQIGRLYDADAHRRITQRLDELRGFEHLHGRIAAASERRPAVTGELEAAKCREAEIWAAIEDRRSALAELEQRIEGLGDARAAASELEERTRARRREAAAADGAVERLGAALEAALRQAAQIADARQREVEAAALHRRYDVLVKAFGRGGIPERIIRNAVPELEAEANEILGRLSDYEMSLRFRFDRQTKSGAAKETFDVLISHDGGVRDFRMFSGGEAFRIAFAVRLGLSKLLVRRAGARLETLVLDEAFGTQDPAGRERLIEAIDLARGEFAKVLVITHLDELKDAFGAQIRVSKDAMEGSRLDFCS